MTLLKGSALFLFVLFGACSASSSNPPSPAPTSQSQAPPDDSIDPTCCDPYANEDVKKAWQTFIKDGRYRLARRSSGQAYAFTWGDLGYAVEPDHHHLAAIIEDTSETENARFGVIIFSAPEGENGTYRTYWLFQGRDLTQATFFKASGYLELLLPNSKGQQESCDIRWNARLKEYYCRKR